MILMCIGILVTPSKGWSWKSMFSKAVDNSYADCLQSHLSFSSNYKDYCDKGKELIEECDFDEDFDCGDDSGDAQFRKRRDSFLTNGVDFIKDYVNVQKDKIIDYGLNKTQKIYTYAEGKATRLIERTTNLTSLAIGKFNKYRELFFSGSSFFEIGKSLTENCNDKAQEVFGKFRAGGKREYVVKIVCGLDGKCQSIC